MAGCIRRWWLSGIALGLLCAGCQSDLGSIAYFFMPEAKEEPALRSVASEDKKVETKVAILIYNRIDPQPELIQVDRMLADLLAKEITKLAKDNEQKVTVVSPRRIEEYKNTHPSRHGPSPEEIGQRFKVDYVIYLELAQMTLFEAGSAKELLQGRTDIVAKVYDIKHPDDGAECKEFTTVYPSGNIPKNVGPDMPPTLFRQQFLTGVARQLSYFFMPHPKRDRVVALDDW